MDVEIEAHVDNREAGARGLNHVFKTSFLMSEEIPAIVEIEKVSQVKYALLALPDTGLVGTIAAGHLVHSKKMNEVGYVRPGFLPPLIVVHDGEPKSPVRLYGNKDLIALISETPLPSSTYRELAKEIAKWAKERETQLLIPVTGIAVQNRLEIEKPEIFGLGGTAETRELLKSRGIRLLEEGFIAGPHAFMLNECIEMNIPIAMLFAQSHSNFPDPIAAVSMLERLNEAFGFDVDVKPLRERAEEFRLKLRELMRRTQQSMSSTQKSQEEEIPAFYR